MTNETFDMTMGSNLKYTSVSFDGFDLTYKFKLNQVADNVMLNIKDVNDNIIRNFYCHKGVTHNIDPYTDSTYGYKYYHLSVYIEDSKLETNRYGVKYIGPEALKLKITVME